MLTCIRPTYDYRVYKACEYKDRTKVANLLTNPRAPMMTKVVKIASVEKNNNLITIEVQVVNKEGGPYEEDQLFLKQ